MVEREMALAEEAEEQQRDDTLAIGVGVAVGAAVGGLLVWAYRRALLRQAEESGQRRALTAVGFPDLARVALAVLGLLRQVAELGR